MNSTSNTTCFVQSCKYTITDAAVANNNDNNIYLSQALNIVNTILIINL